MTPSGLTWFGVALLMGALALWIGSARMNGIDHIRRHDYSYGIYIYHWPIVLMVKAAMPGIDAPALLAMTLLLVVPAAMLSWHFVESPAQQWVRRALKR
jgi:peptidoglycan/LPS O-acetylase OafA/YrhL